MREHEGRLRKSEALTRYVLIDPILRALGWNTEDPDQVEPEFSTQTGRPDYALIWESKPLIMIEAKALGSNLQQARQTGFQYCWQNKVPFYVITDGDVWEAHDLSKMGGEQIISIRLSQDNPGEATRQLLALWRPAMPKVQTAPQSIVLGTPLPVSAPPSPQGISLSEFRKKVKRDQKPPQCIFFPDGPYKDIDRWKDILIAVAEWVAPVVESRLPIHTGPRGRRNLFHNSKAGMRNPQQAGSLWVETHFSAPDCVRYACYLLEQADKSPDEVRVQP